MTSQSPVKHLGDEDSHYEQDLHSVLQSVPSLNESNEAVHTGSPSHVGPYSSPDGENSPQWTSHNNQSKLPMYRTAVPPSTLNTNREWQSPVIPANIPVSLSSPSPTQNGEDAKLLARNSHSKIDYLRQWSISTYKCARQIISEKLGKSTRTVDIELEGHIEQLKETQRKYINVLRLTRTLVTHFYHVVQTQHALGEAFSELAQKSPELQEEFLYNAETQRNLSKNGETLLNALNFFVCSLNTLCNKTMEDTILTVKQFEIARLEYDAYRTDMEELMQGTRGDVMSSRIDEAKRNFSVHKEKYERLRSDVTIKMKFLEENKVKVMHKQLLLFHNAVSSYFSGNQSILEATLKQFNISLKTPNSSSPSWLEQ